MWQTECVSLQAMPVLPKCFLLALCWMDVQDWCANVPIGQSVQRDLNRFTDIYCFPQHPTRDNGAPAKCVRCEVLHHSKTVGRTANHLPASTLPRMLSRWRSQRTCVWCTRLHETWISHHLCRRPVCETNPKFVKKGKRRIKAVDVVDKKVL